MPTLTEETKAVACPFRVVEVIIRNQKLLELEYDATVMTPDGVTRTLPYRLGVGAANAGATEQDPLGRAVLALLRLHEGVMQERDNALARATHMEGQLAAKKGKKE